MWHKDETGPLAQLYAIKNKKSEGMCVCVCVSVCVCSVVCVCVCSVVCVWGGREIDVHVDKCIYT